MIFVLKIPVLSASVVNTRLVPSGVLWPMSITIKVLSAAVTTARSITVARFVIVGWTA